jgi:hypothetical protein
LNISPNGFMYFRGINSFSGAAPPVILIDGIEISWKLFDPEVGITSSPMEMVSLFDVESIDIIRPGGRALMISTYAAANGAISITTKRGSSGSYDSNTNVASFTPLGYQQPVEFYAPKYDTPQSINFSAPDYRTTIYWKPDVLISEDGKADFDFYTSDFPTTYSVVIEGITNNGKIIRQVETIDVR